jgi:hypothetical protein
MSHQQPQQGELGWGQMHLVFTDEDLVREHMHADVAILAAEQCLVFRSRP